MVCGVLFFFLFLFFNIHPVLAKRKVFDYGTAGVPQRTKGPDGALRCPVNMGQEFLCNTIQVLLVQRIV